MKKNGNRYTVSPVHKTLRQVDLCLGPKRRMTDTLK